jgi:RiboL-PSP-HEPN
MSQALNEFVLRAGEIRNDLSFLEQAYELRPRIYLVLDFEKRGQALEMARRFGETVGSQPASVCGPMLVRLIASFERYLRMLMQETVESWAKKAGHFDNLPEGLADRNLVMSGRFIGNSDSPRDYMALDMDALVDNLVTCRAGKAEFKLNSGVFMDLIYGVTSEVIEKSLRTVRINNWINVVGADRTLQTILDVDRVPDATKAVTTRLKKLSRWRNNWAHGGDDEVSLTFTEVNEELEFVVAFSSALDSAVTKQIQTARLP